MRLESKLSQHELAIARQLAYEMEYSESVMPILNDYLKD